MLLNDLYDILLSNFKEGAIIIKNTTSKKNKSFYFFVLTRLFGRSLDEVGISFALSIIIGGLVWVEYGFTSNLLMSLVLIYCLVMFLFDVAYFLQAIWWVKFRSPKGVFGYLRMDNTIEIHIGSTNSTTRFFSKLRRTLRYAQEHGYMIEYTSGFIPYGRLISQFGRAVVSVRTPGIIARSFNIWGTKKFVANVSYNVEYPIKVVVDPNKLTRKRTDTETMRQGENKVL